MIFRLKNQTIVVNDILKSVTGLTKYSPVKHRDVVITWILHEPKKTKREKNQPVKNRDLTLMFLMFSCRI